MKSNRIKNTTRNITFGIILKVYQIFCPFLMRTIMIYTLGLEYVGLNSLFTSILQILNLTELGVGTAMVYSMYKPIAENNEEIICALMNLYKKYYRIIGTVIAVVGVVLTPFIPELITGGIPNELNIYILYLLNLTSTVISYWLFAYKNCILVAVQRSDLVSKITLFANSIQYILQFLILIILKNYYYFIISIIVGQILINLLTAHVANKNYPNFYPKGKLNKKYTKEINNRVKDLFTAKLGGVIQNSVDSVVISRFLGLQVLALYNNYYYILSSIHGFAIIIFNSCLASVGNSIITESEEKNYYDFEKLTFVAEWLAGFSSCCLICLYQPFMKIWIGQKNLLPYGVVICFSLYSFIAITNQMLCVYKDGAGIWHSDRLRPLITSMINLILNIITVQYIGLYGVVLSTILSMLLIGMPWMIHNIFEEIFHKNMKHYLKKILYYILVTFVTCIVTTNLCFKIEDLGIITMIIKLVICIIVSNSIFLIAYIKTKEFANVMKMFDKMFKHKIVLFNTLNDLSEKFMKNKGE